MLQQSPVSRFSGQFRFLSNFYPAQVEYEGIVYPSVEHAYQAAKTLSKPIRERIKLTITAGAAKKFGRELQLRSDWEDIKLDVMEELLRKKFSAPLLKSLLLATGERELIEGNHWGDRFWGVCNGTGSNWLGKLLMKIRKELKG